MTLTAYLLLYFFWHEPDVWANNRVKILDILKGMGEFASGRHGVLGAPDKQKRTWGPGGVGTRSGDWATSR